MIYTQTAERVENIRTSHIVRRLPFDERFWNKVDVLDEDSCWIWHGAKKRTGYGMMNVRDDKNCKRREILAHRAAYELIFDLIPDYLLVRHMCDIKLCVNPKHLKLGTLADNVQDMVERKRHVGAMEDAECPSCGTVFPLHRSP